MISYQSLDSSIESLILSYPFYSYNYLTPTLCSITSIIDYQYSARRSSFSLHNSSILHLVFESTSNAFLFHSIYSYTATQCS